MLIHVWDRVDPKPIRGWDFMQRNWLHLLSFLGSDSQGSLRAMNQECIFIQGSYRRKFETIIFP